VVAGGRRNRSCHPWISSRQIYEEQLAAAFTLPVAHYSIGKTSPCGGQGEVSGRARRWRITPWIKDIPAPAIEDDERLRPMRLAAPGSRTLRSSTVSRPATTVTCAALPAGTECPR
jgi:hypothetical protein